MLTEIRKKEVLIALSDQLDSRATEINQYMFDLTASLTSETKSTAGDKHDTGRAMIHLEQEKLQHQVQEIQLQLQRIRALQHSEKLDGGVGFGSFIKAGQFYFLIGIGMGKQLVNGHIVYCVGSLRY